MNQSSDSNSLRQVISLFLLGCGALLAACGDGDGGGSGPVNDGPPAVSFNAPSPATVAPGGSFTLSWTATAVSSCTASGGSSSDGWGGAEPGTGSATLTASATPGTYEYTLTCNGMGVSSGSTAAATAAEIVSTPTSSASAPVFGTAFTATPSTVTAGGTITLSWAVSGAAACTASGGDGSDNWIGNEPTSSPSGGVSIQTSSTAGSYTYALSCSGTGGSAAQTATITVGAAVTGPVFSTALGATPSTVSAGSQFVLSWATTGATACTASGGDGSPAWSGAEPTSSPSGGVKLTASTAPGTYAYLLSCSGPSGTTTQIVNVLVGPFDCAVPNLPTQALLTPHAAATTATGGVLCLVCSVNQPGNVIDANPLNYAAILTQVALLDASESLAVTNDTAFPAGRTVGFVVANPTQLLTLDLLQSFTLSTYLNGTLQETSSVAGDPLKLSLLQLGLIGTTQPSFVSFKTTKSFDGIAITDGPVAGVLGEVDVYHACVSQQ